MILIRPAIRDSKSMDAWECCSQKKISWPEGEEEEGKKKQECNSKKSWEKVMGHWILILVCEYGKSLEQSPLNPSTGAWTLNPIHSGLQGKLLSQISRKSFTSWFTLPVKQIVDTLLATEWYLSSFMLTRRKEKWK